jgi:hypothetical protein
VTRTHTGPSAANAGAAQRAQCPRLRSRGRPPAGEQCRRHRLDRGHVGEAPAGRRVVEGEAEAQVAGRGDRGDAAERRGDAARQLVGAAVAAEQRHGDAAVLGDGDDRGLGRFVGEQRRAGADQHAGGADADDRRPGSEQRTQMRAHVGERKRVFGDAGVEAVQDGAGQRVADTPRRREAARPEHDHGGHRHAAPRRWTSTIEK